MDDLAERHLGHACISFDQVMAHAPGKKAEQDVRAAPARQGDRVRGRGRRRDAAAVDAAEAAARGGTASSTVYETLERPLLPVLATWSAPASRSTPQSCRGCPAHSRKRVARLEEEINGLVGHKFNLGSPQAARRIPVRPPEAARRQEAPRPGSGRRGRTARGSRGQRGAARAMRAASSIRCSSGAS